MNLKKSVLTGVTLAISGVSLVVLAPNKAQASSVLNWSEPTELQTLDVSKVLDTVSSDMLGSSMEGLYRLGNNSEVTPGIAEKTEVSDDGLTYTFTLRKDAKWSNGDPVTAKDFVYSWQRTVNPKTGSEYAYLFNGVKNAEAVNKGEKPLSELGVKADGDYKLVVTLDHQIPYFKKLMGFTIFFPQNENAVKKYGKKYGTQAKYTVYNGPFQLKDWNGSNLSWKLVKNKSYWDKKNVKLSEANFQVNKSTSTSYNLFQSGKLDSTYLNSEQAKQLKNKPEFLSREQGRMNYLEMNENNKLFKNEKVRQAVSYAVNRKQLVDHVLGNGSLAPEGIVSKGLMKYDGKDFADAAKTKEGVSYDAKKAQKLWAEGLKESGVKNPTITLVGDDTDVAKNVTEYLQSQLQTNLKGLKVKVQNVPMKNRISRAQDGKFDLILSGWGADFSDPISFLDLFTSDNAQNYGKWSNEEYDKLIEASKTTDAGDPAKRWDDMVKASKVLSQNQGVVPLYQLSQATMMNKNVKGLVYNTAGIQYNFKEVNVK